MDECRNPMVVYIEDRLIAYREKLTRIIHAFSMNNDDT